VSEPTQRISNVLDHGYVRLIETWGSDERIVEAARMSTGKGFLGWGPRIVATLRQCRNCMVIEDEPGAHDLCLCPADDSVRVHVWGEPDVKRYERGDEHLLRYLYTHRHETPFEMAGAIVEVQAPIMVFREWQRHRTQSYNEMSARYEPLPDTHYVPTVDRCLATSEVNRQASRAKGTREPRRIEVEGWLVALQRAYQLAEDVYQEGLRRGIPKELARLPVSVARYSRMRASANLRNWLAFMTLRCHPTAQYEIRQYANVMSHMLEAAFPRTMELFAEFELRVVGRGAVSE